MKYLIDSAKCNPLYTINDNRDTPHHIAALCGQANAVKLLTL